MTFCASAFEPLFASHGAAPVPRCPARTAALMLQTLAATPIGTLTVTGTPRLLSAEIWSLLRKPLRMLTSWIFTATRPFPLPVLTCASAGVAAMAIAAAANIILRITYLHLVTDTKQERQARSILPPNPGGVGVLNDRKPLFLHGLPQPEAGCVGRATERCCEGGSAGAAAPQMRRKFAKFAPQRARGSHGSSPGAAGARSSPSVSSSSFATSSSSSKPSIARISFISGSGKSGSGGNGPSIHLPYRCGRRVRSRN